MEQFQQFAQHFPLANAFGEDSADLVQHLQLVDVALRVDQFAL